MINKLAVAYHQKGKSRELFLERVQEYLDEAIEAGEFETGGKVSLRAINEITDTALEAAKIWQNLTTYSIVVTSTKSALPDVYEVDASSTKSLHDAIGTIWSTEYRQQGYAIIQTQVTRISNLPK